MSAYPGLFQCHLIAVVGDNGDPTGRNPLTNFRDSIIKSPIPTHNVVEEQDVPKEKEMNETETENTPSFQANDKASTVDYLTDKYNISEQVVGKQQYHNRSRLHYVSRNRILLE